MQKRLNHLRSRLEPQSAILDYNMLWNILTTEVDMGARSEYNCAICVQL